MPSARPPRAPLLWLLLPLMGGLTSAKLWPHPTAGLMMPAVLAVIASVGAVVAGCRDTRGGRLGWAVCLGLAGGLGGFVYLHLRVPGLGQPDEDPPQEIHATLRVKQNFPASSAGRNWTGLATVVACEIDPDLRGRQVYFSAIRRISLAPLPSGEYFVRGVLEAVPPDTTGVGFTSYLASLGIRQQLVRAQILRETRAPGWFARSCHGAQRKLESILTHGVASHPQAASLYVAMLVGGKAEMTPDQQNAFMRSGTYHIFSISGLHIGVIALALDTLLRRLRLSRRAAAATSLAILWLYVEITGSSAPALRSLLMIGFLLAMRVLQLPGNALAALTASAVVILVLDPVQLFGAGFQMSYSVVIALLLMGGPLAEKWLEPWKPFAFRPRPEWRWWHRGVDALGRRLLGSLAACWVAFLASTPSGIGYFEAFSPGSLVANLVIIPLSSFTIMLGFASLVIGLAGLLPVCGVLNTVAVLTIELMDRLLARLMTCPGVYFPAHFRWAGLTSAAIAAMTALILVGADAHWSRRRGGFWPPAVFIALVLMFAVKFG